jgi:hypothetical protein
MSKLPLPAECRTNAIPDSGIVHMNILSLALALWLLPVPAAAQGGGSVTLLEGSLRVIRGVNVLKGAEGMRLRQGDLLETSDKGFAQLEFAGGAVVALGPVTQVFVYRQSGEKAQQTELVLLSGWLKGESAAGAGTYRYSTPIVAAMTGAGTVLVHNSEGACDVFVESGSATIGEVGGEGGIRAPVPAKAGQFFSRHAGKSISTAARPNAAFLEAMPHPFRDTLPSRLARFAGKSIEPKPDHAVAYTDVQAWLKMPAAWRRGFVERFSPRLKDPEFRKQVEAHVAEHPEWDKALHPEKQPEEKSAPGSNP